MRIAIFYLFILVYLIAVGLMLPGCTAFDMADLQHTETVSHETIIDTEILQDAGFTDEQIEALRESVKVEIKTTESSAKVRGKPAQEFEMVLPGMSLSVREIIDPAEFSKILYWIGGVSVILAVLMGKFFGWGFGIIFAAFGLSLIAMGRLMAASPWIAVAPGIALVIGVGYLLWRLYIGKIDHEVAYDASDILTDKQKKDMPRKDRVQLEKLKGESFLRKLI